MGQFTLTWIAVVCFCGLVLWGSNVPVKRNTPVVFWISGIFVFLHLILQSYFFKVDSTPTSSPESRQAALKALNEFMGFLHSNALQPGSLELNAPSGWYRIITSSVLHYGWLPLLFNLWFLVLLGHVLEAKIGRARFLGLFLCGFIIPSALDGFFRLGMSLQTYTGGMSGVVYAMMGAYLVLFPRSRIYGAMTYDLKFWAVMFFIILPVTMVTRHAGMALTEIVLILSTVAVFLLLQPEHSRISLPIFTVLLLKLTQDVLFIQPAIRDVISNSFWRIGGGLFLGVGMGLLFNGVRGWTATWEDKTSKQNPGRRTTNRSRTPIAQLESEGKRTIEGARIFLGQRVFVGDADRVSTFYKDVVIPQFPELMLPIQEQMALARLLEFKKDEAEALHAYEVLLKNAQPLPEEYWSAWLRAAELTMKIYPDHTIKVRNFLDEFESDHVVVARDRIEAERLRARLPVVESKHKSIPAKNRVVGNRIASENTDGNTPDVMAMPRRQLVTFFLDPDGSAKFRERKLVVREDETLANPEILKSFWKPLPSKAETTSILPLERPVKQYRYVEEDASPTAYSSHLDVKSGRVKKSRLSNLEVPYKEILPESRTTTEMPGKYGGLDDDPENEKPFAIRLRGEPLGQERELKELRKRTKPTDRPAQWKTPLEVKIKPELVTDGYGEMKETQDNAETLAVPPNGLEHVEVFGVVMDSTGILFKTGFGSRKIAWADVRLMSIGRMRLTLNSTADPKLLMEIVVTGNPGIRYQMFERTLMVRGSSVEKQPIELVDKLIVAAWVYAQKSTDGHTICIPAGGHNDVPVYENYSSYHLLIEKKLLEIG